MSKSDERNDNDVMRVAALKYDQDVDSAPRVVAAGTGYMAQKILQVAMENGIPIYHDDSAATLLSKLELGGDPTRLYQIVVISIFPS